MKQLVVGAMAVVVLVSGASIAQAKCFGFRGQEIRVCVDGNDNAARRRATEVCSRVTGSSCDVSGYSGECRRSSSTRCYDGEGHEQRQIESE